MTPSHSEFLHGIRDELPILLGVLPFGMIYGVSAISAGIPASIAQAMSCIVFAGSAQFVITQLIAAGTPLLVVILTAFIVNIRHMLYSASMSSYTRKLHPLWKWLLAYLLTDEAYAVAILHYQKAGDDRQKHWYFLGAELALWTTWQLSTAVGIFLGGHIPASWSLDFASTLTFIALVVPTLKDRVSTNVALTSAVTALLVIALPLKLGIALAALAGIAVGLTLEIKKTKSLKSLS
jgi:4-azaleucine resistance transporter AzlC